MRRWTHGYGKLPVLGPGHHVVMRVKNDLEVLGTCSQSYGRYQRLVRDRHAYCRRLAQQNDNDLIIDFGLPELRPARPKKT